MEARRYGQYLILRNIIDSDGDGEKVAAYFKGPCKAANFALKNLYTGV